MSGPWTITQEREERAAKEGTDAIQAPRAILDTVDEEPEVCCTSDKSKDACVCVCVCVRVCVCVCACVCMCVCMYA